MPPARTESRATTAGKWLFALMVPASGLALGAVPAEVLLVVSGIAALACGLLSMEPHGKASRATRWVLLALTILLAMTILQAIPLPAGLTRTLTPANADIWERALSPLREPGPAWHPLSIAPGATRVEVLRGFFYGCVFLGALRIAALERGEQFLVRLVVFASCVMALTTLAHMAVGAEKIFGVYRPHELHAYRAGRLGPLLNTNHLAAYLNVGACVALGALVTGRFMPRALSASVALVLASTSVWQGSRGATAALLLGVVLTVALTVYSKRRFANARADALILGACAVAAAFMGSIALSDVAREHLVVTDVTKLDVAKSATHLIGSSPWFGVGRGGFESVFSSVREGTTYVTFTNPEDIFVQWFVEWGLPVSLATMGILAWALRPHVVLRAVRPAVGAWAAVVIAVAQDLVDYHLETPGVVALVAICVAIVVSGRASRDSGREPPSFARMPAAVAIAGTVLAGIAVWPELDHTLAEERRKLSAMAVDKAVTREQFTTEVRAAILRFPAEPFLPLMAAVRAQTRDEGSVVPWIARALERSPRFGRAHFVLARSLAYGHEAQARLEYRLAFENDQQLRDQVVKEGARLVVDTDSALEMVPDGPAGIEMLDALVMAVGSRLPATSHILDREIERRMPTATGPLRRRADAAVDDATEGAPWCSGKSCIIEATPIVDTLLAREPQRCESHVLLARLRAANGEVVRGLDGLERAQDTVTDRAACLRELINLAIAKRENARADAALDKLVRGGCGSAGDCSELYTWAANMEEGRGHYARAVRLLKRLLEITPDRDDLLEHIGELGEHSGVLGDALEAYGILQARHPGDPRWPARIAELRAKAHAAPPPAPP